MIVNEYSTIILGSSDLETSVAEEEIVPSSKRLVNFQLINDQNCHISLNGGGYIFVRANQGINIPVVYSCKIQEDNITYNWIGQEK